MQSRYNKQKECGHQFFLRWPLLSPCMHGVALLGAAHSRSGKEDKSGPMWMLGMAVSPALSATQEYHRLTQQCGGQNELLVGPLGRFLDVDRLRHAAHGRSESAKEVRTCDSDSVSRHTLLTFRTAA